MVPHRHHLRTILLAQARLPPLRLRINKVIGLREGVDCQDGQ